MKLINTNKISINASVLLKLSVFVCSGAGQEVPADRRLPQHEGDPDQEERADQRDQETTAEVRRTTRRGNCYGLASMMLISC